MSMPSRFLLIENASHAFSWWFISGMHVTSLSSVSPKCSNNDILLMNLSETANATSLKDERPEMFVLALPEVVFADVNDSGIVRRERYA